MDFNEEIEMYSSAVRVEQKRSFYRMFSNFVSGAVGATFSMLFGGPLWTLKSRYQNPNVIQKVPSNLLHLYRGVGMNVACQSPIVGLQVVGSEVVQRTLCGDKEPTSGQKLFSNLCGGGASALLATPVDRTTTVMQHNGKSFFETSTGLFQNGVRSGMVGFSGTALRDAKFVAGCFWLRGEIKKRLLPYFGEEHEFSVGMGSGMLAGVGSGLGSQPWDALKTEQQALANAGESLPLWSLAKQKYYSQGVKSFFRGGMCRCAKVVGISTPIIGTTVEIMERRRKRRQA